jgi:DNA repair protein SbcC/Rad50
VRVHRLEVEAFGPFAERVVVDIDRVGAAGLFLVHGPTGSGKTSLLDAVCYALYADVPGARSKRSLRSDHAHPDAAPQVVVELTVGRRRLRITRSPEWQRPKRRGEGTRKVQASVLLEERLGRRWVPVASRHDEVALVVQDLLAMGLRQFAQVVMLPQGDFAAFLRASPEDRRAVLEQLFDIEVFADIESWLADTRRAAASDVDTARSALRLDLLRVDDLLAEALPAIAEPWGPEWPGGICEPDYGIGGLATAPITELPARLTDLGVMLDEQVSEASAAVDRCESAEHAAARALATARDRATARSRGDRAAAVLASMDHDAHRRHMETLDAARRAASVSGHLAALARAEREVADLTAQADGAHADVSARGVVVGPGTAASVAAGMHVLDGAAADLTRQTEVLSASEQRCRRAGAERDDARAGEERARAGRGEAVAALQRAESEISRLDGTAVRVAGLGATVADLEQQLDLVGRIAADVAVAEALAPDLLRCRDLVLARQQTLLDRRQQRLDGMAAELAAALRTGSTCPVCGSLAHPAPATMIETAVTAEAIATSERELDAARTELEEVDRQLTSLAAAIDTRRSALGGAEQADIAGRLEQARSALARAERDDDLLGDLRRRLLVLRRSVETATDEHSRAAAHLAALEDRVRRFAEDVAAARVALDLATTAHAACPCGSPDPARHREVAASLDAFVTASRAVSAALERVAVAERDLGLAVAEAGLDSVDRARDALLSPVEIERLGAEKARYDERAAAAQAVLDEADVAEALTGAPPDVAAADRELADRRREVLAASRHRDVLLRAHTALRRSLPALLAGCAEVSRRQERYAAIRDLADTAGGTGGDNTLRMRLSSFVLAARLEKVVALANERLQVMGEGRYVLEHSDELAARGARSGLGLRVVDQWTSRARETASLSGGESFMASLALALGLGDALREESGGLDLDTLFVDEGFGSLDDDSLEQVITVLDGLREGGRVVGVVSHLAELRARVTHQVAVHKRATGSSVEIRTDDHPAA